MPELDATRVYIRQLYARHSSAVAIEALANELRNELFSQTPQDTGVLAEALSEIGSASWTGHSWEMGVGNKQRMGEPGDKTEGTIAAFLHDNPKFYLSDEQKKDMGFTKAKAWSFLSPEGKEALFQARWQGEYGGPEYNSGGPARYGYAQSGDKAEWAASSAGAGRTPTHFIGNALAAWRTKIDTIVRRAIG